MASPGNQHCASCIGTLSFPIPTESARHNTVRSLRAWTLLDTLEMVTAFVTLETTYTRPRPSIMQYPVENKLYLIEDREQTDLVDPDLDL